jgi:hypothetical protein
MSDHVMFSRRQPQRKRIKKRTAEAQRPQKKILAADTRRRTRTKKTVLGTRGQVQTFRKLGFICGRIFEGVVCLPIEIHVPNRGMGILVHV